MPPKWTANKKFNIVPPRKGQKNGRRTVTEAATDDADVESPKKTFRIIDSLPPSPEKATQAPSSDDQSPVKVFKMPPPNLEETLDAPPEDSDDDVPNCDDLYSTDEEEDRANIKPSLGKKAKGKDIKAATIIRTRRSPKVKETLSGVKRKSDELDVSIPNLELDKLFAKRKKQKPAYGKKVAAKDKTTKQPEPVRCEYFMVSWMLSISLMILSSINGIRQRQLHASLLCTSNPRLAEEKAKACSHWEALWTPQYCRLRHN